MFYSKFFSKNVQEKMESVPKVTSTNLQDTMYEGSPKEAGVGREGGNTTCIITENTHCSLTDALVSRAPLPL